MYSSVNFLAHNNQTRFRIASAPDHRPSTSSGFCLFYLSLHSPSRKLSLNSYNGILSLLWTTLDFLLVIVLYWILLVHKWFFTEDTCMCLCVWRMVMKPAPTSMPHRRAAAGSPLSPLSLSLSLSLSWSCLSLQVDAIVQPRTWSSTIPPQSLQSRSMANSSSRRPFCAAAAALEPLKHLNGAHIGMLRFI